MVDHSAAVCGVAAAFLTLSAIAVILRCYVRLRIVKAFGWDDFIMILAMLFYVAFCGSMIGGSIWGTGRHLTELTAKQRTVAMKYWFLCDVMYAVSSVLAKISVAIFLLRVMLFPCHKIALYTVTAFAVSTGIVFFILLVVQCSPVSFWWRRMSGATDGHCGYIDAIAIMLYIFSAASAIFDMTVGLLPIMLVRKLQMNRRTKVAVAGLLGMACIASIAIIIRIPFVHTIRDPDFLYATVQIAIWSAIETGLSITAGSLATIRPLFRLFFSQSQLTSADRPFDPSNQDQNRNPTRKSRKHSRAKSRSSTGLSTKKKPRDPAYDHNYPLSDFDSGLGFERKGSLSTSGSTRGLSVSESLKDENQWGGSFSPYIGMTTMRSTVEGAAPSPYSSVGAVHGPGVVSAGRDSLELLRSRMEYEAGTKARASADTESGSGLVSVPVAAAHPAAPSGSVIGVHRTFEVSSVGRDDMVS
ncbi:hypothetical protein BJX99DRAFT_93675 [Aspergillus californicus]